MKLAITMDYNKVLVVDAENAAEIIKAFSTGEYYQEPGYGEGKQYKPIVDEVPQMKFVRDEMFEAQPERLKVLQEENKRMDERYWQLYSEKSKLEKELKEIKDKAAKITAAASDVEDHTF
jgi:predicted RNase H-like nuclease (RuvC/YqgF family)